MKTKLIIDTSSISSLEGLPSFVEVMPLGIIESQNGEEKAYDDIKQINSEEILKGINEGKKFKTSLPNLAYIYDSIEKDYDKYDRIIINPISSKLSNTYSTIQGVIKEIDKENKVFLLDSKFCSNVGWIFNNKLFKMIEEKKSNEEIIKELEIFKKNHGLFFFLTDIDFLIKGGRVSNLKGFIAKKIGLVVAIFWREGELKSLAKDKSLEKLFEKCLKMELQYKNKSIEDLKKITYYYDKKNDEEKFKNLLDKIKKQYPKIEIQYHEYKLPNAIFIHTGKGGIYFDLFF